MLIQIIINFKLFFCYKLISNNLINNLRNNKIIHDSDYDIYY